MDREEIRRQLQQIFSQVFGRPVDVHDALTAADVPGWDSLNHIRLVLTVQRAFRVRFSAAEAGSIPDAGQLIELIERKQRPL
jgi:acyl carrier protein